MSAELPDEWDSNTVDIPFYLGRPAAVSFSPYPFTDYPEYEGIIAFVQNHCKSYRRFYLVRRANPTWDRDEWQRAYGSFIADLMVGRVQDYPGIVVEGHLSDADVFQIVC